MTSNSNGSSVLINNGDGSYTNAVDDIHGNAKGIDSNNETCFQAQEKQSDATPPVDKNEVPVGDQSETTRTYSLLKVRILLPVITSLFFCHGTIHSVLFQYLLERWSIEAGHNASMHRHSSMCGRNKSDDDAAKQANAIQSRVADTSAYLTWCSSGPALLTCLVFGALVDLIGRKPAIVLSQLGTTLQILTIVIVIRFNLSTDLFYLAYVLDGVGGSFMMYLVANLSSTADISGNKKSRILWITIVVTFSHVFVSGANVAVGLVIKHFGYVAAGLTSLAPVTLALTLSILFLPETLPTKRQKISLKKVVKHNSRVLFLYTRDGSRETRLSLVFSMLIFFTVVLNHMPLHTMETLFQKHAPLCWDSVRIGYFAAFRNVTRGICGLLYLWVTRRFGCSSDEMNSMVSMLFLAGSYVVEAFAKNDWDMFLVPIISIPSSNVSPITRGVMSYLAGPGKQGVLFSSIALIDVVCMAIGTTTYSKVYAATVGFMPGAIFFVMAAMCIVTFLLYIPFFHFYERPPKEDEKP